MLNNSNGEVRLVFYPKSVLKFTLHTCDQWVRMG